MATAIARVRRLRAGPPSIAGVSGTDGLEVTSRPLGPALPASALVVQDGFKRLPAGLQNLIQQAHGAAEDPMDWLGSRPQPLNPSTPQRLKLGR